MKQQLNQSELTKLRVFVQTRLSSGISPESLSLQLLSCLPQGVLTRATFTALALPWMELPMTTTEALSNDPPFNPVTNKEISDEETYAAWRDATSDAKSGRGPNYD